LKIAGRVGFLTLFSGYQPPPAIVATHPRGGKARDHQGENRRKGQVIPKYQVRNPTPCFTREIKFHVSLFEKIGPDHFHGVGLI
jgi:hypothetical protein